MKTQFTIFLLLTFIIPSFGQNKDSNQILKILPSKDIKTLPPKNIGSIPCGVIYDVKNDRRYTALRERHTSRYPNSTKYINFTRQNPKTPELQPTLKEIRF